MRDARVNKLFCWFVFDVPPGTKRGYRSGKRNNGHRWDATNDPERIKYLFGRLHPQANLGIPTGEENGFWVLEGDTPKGHSVDGIASLRKLERQYGRLSETLMAISPSGSLHYYFRWPRGGLVVRGSISKIAPGVDVRGHGNMVLAPPSRKPGVAEPYGFLNWGTPGADAPDWLLRLVVDKKKCAKRKHLASQSESVDRNMIQRALNVIVDDDYASWLEIGAALANAFGDAGYEWFDTWSARSPKYVAETCAAKWDECIKLAPHYGVGTIFHYATMSDSRWRAVYEAQRFASLYSFRKASGQ